MKRKAARAAKKIRQEELQYFRAFLDRMGPEHRLELLDTIHIARFLCCISLGCDQADVHLALENFVSKRGPIVYPDFAVGFGVQLPDERREAYLSDFKRMLEVTDNLRFKYTPLDRFIQYLLAHPDVVQEYI